MAKKKPMWWTTDMIHYGKFLLAPCMTSITAVSLLKGGSYMWVGLMSTIVLMLIADNLLGDDHSHPQVTQPYLMVLPILAAFPAVFGLQLSLAYSVRPGVMAASGSGGWDFLAALLACAFATAGNGMTVGHELIHQTHKRSRVNAGRWMFALIGNADFSIEHVQGHHARIGTFHDPATARHGESVYQFVARAVSHGHMHAWQLEKARLRRKGVPLWSWHNRMLTGYLMTLTWLSLFAVVAGYRGILLFIAQASLGRFLLELTNYIEHYGLCRHEHEKILPQHSWNSDRLFSHIMLLALPRHADHHANGRLAFYQLGPCLQAPQLPFGYLSCMVIALIPPLWFSMMDKELRKLQR